MNSETTLPSSAIPDEGFATSVKGAAIAGFKELLGGICHWRISHLIGVRDLRHRYARSKLGQVWLMVSTGVMIGVLSVVWSLLWRQPIHELMPFIGVSLIIWNYLSQVLLDSTSIFIVQGHLYRNQRMNFSVSIYSVIYKNTIMLAHSLIVIVVLIVALRRSSQFESSATRASIRTHVDWNDLVRIHHRNDMRTFSRCHSSDRHLVDGLILYHASYVEARVPSARVSFNH